MAQDPDKPLDDGRVRLPSTDSAMNRIAPSALRNADQRRQDPVALRPGGVTKGSAEEQQFLARVRRRFDRCLKAQSEAYRAGLDDDKFYAGDQWPSSVQQQRGDPGNPRPMLTINKLPTLVHQVTGDYRQNPPAINVNPVGDKGDVEVAKFYRGMIRQIERASGADDALGAYCTAFESKCRKGFGYWRIVTEYEDPKSNDQVLVIKRIRNAFTVYLDPDAQEAEGSDARFGFITEEIPRTQFEDDFPGADPMAWVQGGPGEAFKEWVKQDVIRIAEYFEITEEVRELVTLSNGHVGWGDELGDLPRGVIVTFRRKSKIPKCKWYKLTAKEILEEEDWPGQWIPIVRDVGEEVDIEGQVKCWGIVRHAKDAQRMFNYWRSAETELVALAPKAPWLLAEGQDEGHENEWRTANTKAHVALHWKPTTLAGHPVPPPQREPFAGVPAGVVGAAANAAQDMLATTGIRFDATQNERMYDESGRALRELRRSGDIGNFHLIDNHATSKRHTARILMDLIPHIYYQPDRILTITREDDKDEQVGVNQNQGEGMIERRDPRTRQVMKIYNPTHGRYGVTPTIGPSYATKRIESAESMMDFARAMPAVAAVIPDLIAKSQDWPGAEEIATRLAKTLDPKLLTPEPKDIPPQVQAIMQSQAGQIQQLTQQLAASVKALVDQDKDRALKREKQDQDFEAKLLAVVQKAQASHDAHVGSQLKDLAQAVTTLHEHLANPQPNGRMQ